MTYRSISSTLIQVLSIAIFSNNGYDLNCILYLCQRVTEMTLQQ